MKKMVSMALLVAAMMSASLSASAECRKGELQKGKKAEFRKEVQFRGHKGQRGMKMEKARLGKRDVRFDKRFDKCDARFDKRFAKHHQHGKCGKHGRFAKRPMKGKFVQNISFCR